MSLIEGLYRQESQHTLDFVTFEPCLHHHQALLCGGGYALLYTCRSPAGTRFLSQNYTQRACQDYTQRYARFS